MHTPDWSAQRHQAYAGGGSGLRDLKVAKRPQK